MATSFGSCALLFSLNNHLTPLDGLSKFPAPMTFASVLGIGVDDPVYEQLMAAQVDYPWIHYPGAKVWTDMKLNASIPDIQQRYPFKLLTLQDAWGGSFGSYRINNAWAGYWLYGAGTRVLNDLSPGTTNLTVELPDRVTGNLSAPIAHTLVLCRLDEDGRPDFNYAEQVTVNAIDGNTFQVDRGSWNTEALSFTASNTMVATHIKFWSGQWQMNLSLECPRGGTNNLTAAEWWADVVKQGLELTGTHGVEFDVARWTFGNASPQDCNNDGVVDYGWIDGVNSFGLGGQVFLKRLRESCPDAIIQFDSNNPRFGQRGWQYVNGIQNECFPGENKFSRFSEEFLHLRLWCENVTERPAISYPFTKCATSTYSGYREKDGSSTDWRFRIGLAAACLLGMPHPFVSELIAGYTPEDTNTCVFGVGGGVVPTSGSTYQTGVYRWDEYFGGDLKKAGWLGSPEASAVRFNDHLNLETNLLETEAAYWTIDSSITAVTSVSNGTYTVNVQYLPPGIDPHEYYFSATLEVPLALGESLGGGITLTNGVTLEPGDEYTVCFDVWGNDSWTVNGETYDKVPRMVTIGGVLDDDESPIAVFADSEWRTIEITMVAGDSPQKSIRFGCSEQVGETRIRNIRLYRGGMDCWMREFKDGLVLLNMTLKDWACSLPPGTWRRLSGAQNPDVNSGAVESGTVIVPSYDGLFLRKDSVE